MGERARSRSEQVWAKLDDSSGECGKRSEPSEVGFSEGKNSYDQDVLRAIRRTPFSLSVHRRGDFRLVSKKNACMHGNECAFEV